MSSWCSAGWCVFVYTPLLYPTIPVPGFFFNSYVLCLLMSSTIFDLFLSSFLCQLCPGEQSSNSFYSNNIPQTISLHFQTCIKNYSVFLHSSQNLFILYFIPSTFSVLIFQEHQSYPYISSPQSKFHIHIPLHCSITLQYVLLHCTTFVLHCSIFTTLQYVLLHSGNYIVVCIITHM